MVVVGCPAYLADHGIPVERKRAINST
jgi:hypothetical protein